MSLPKSTAELLDLGTQCNEGLADLGVALGILQYTETTFGPIVGALQTKQDAFNTARSSTATAYENYHSALALARKSCGDARKLLSISWGEEWTTEWAQAGWNNHTTRVPRSDAEIATLCGSLKAFLTEAANADYIVDTPKIVFTAAQFNALGTLLTQKDDLLSDARTAQGEARDDRNEDDDALRAAIRGLIGILETKLGPLDPRWDQFGLPRPGATATPGQPANLAATVSGSGVLTVTAQCDPVPLATYYRWFAKLEGVDTAFRFLGRTNDPLKQITGQPAIGTLHLKVEAANEAGPGNASAPLAVTLG